MSEFYLKPKFFSVIKGYTKQQFAKDVVAGVIVAIIAIVIISNNKKKAALNTVPQYAQPFNPQQQYPQR